MGNTFNIQSENKKGVYAIVNVKKMRCYIGSSSRIKTRANQHKNDLIANRHANKFLQTDFNNNFDFEFLVLELCEEDKETLTAKEKMYMLEALENGFELYNLMPCSKYDEQANWIRQHLIWFLLRRNNTKKNLVKSFRDRYGVTPGCMKHRRERNRF